MLSSSAAWGMSRTDVEYGRAGEISLRMDAHVPEGKGPFPAVILVHGGAWVGGDRTWNVKPLFRPLEQAGFAWFSISYRLASDFLQFGVAVDDVQLAVDYVRSHSEEYHIDANRIALVGESAGGHLASMAALTAGRDHGVNAVVALYTPSDLVTLAKTSPMVPEAIRQAASGTMWADLLLRRLKQLSPIEHVSKNSPPFLLIHGTADTVVPYDQSQAMYDKMKKAGADCTIYTVDGGAHGMWRWQGRTEYSGVLIDWLKNRLGVSQTRAAIAVGQ